MHGVAASSMVPRQFSFSEEPHCIQPTEVTVFVVIRLCTGAPFEWSQQGWQRRGHFRGSEASESDNLIEIQGGLESADSKSIAYARCPPGSREVEVTFECQGCHRATGDFAALQLEVGASSVKLAGFARRGHCPSPGGSQRAPPKLRSSAVPSQLQRTSVTSSLTFTERQ